MSLAILYRGFWYVAASLAAFAFLLSSAAAQDLYLTDGNAFPGQIWRSDAGTAEQLVHRREPKADAAFPNAVMKAAQVACAPGGKLFYCSGLDGYVMHLLDGRHEIASFEFAGQIRDIACTHEKDTVYFSVVRTPQNGEALADGKIYRRRLGDARPTEVAVVHQSKVGGNWWGTFMVRNDVILIATTEEHSRFFKLTGAGPELIFPENTYAITGFSPAPEGQFFFTTGGEKVYRTPDFASAETVLHGERNFTDVTLRTGE